MTTFQFRRCKRPVSPHLPPPLRSLLTFSKLPLMRSTVATKKCISHWSISLSSIFTVRPSWEDGTSSQEVHFKVLKIKHVYVQYNTDSRLFWINFYSYTPIKKHLNDRCNKNQNFASLGFTYTGFLRLYVLFEICLPWRLVWSRRILLLQDRYLDKFVT